MINIIFLFVYVLFSDALSPITLNYLLSVQCAMLIVLYLRKYKKAFVTPIFLFYASVILVNYANLSLINEYKTGTIRPGNFLVPALIGEAIKLWCISCTFIMLGYDFLSSKGLPSIAIEINNKKIFSLLFWILLIINLRKIIFPNSPLELGSDFKLINIFSILFFARLWTKENSKTYRAYALTLYIVITYIAIISAFLRFDLILPTVSLFAGFFIGKENLKYLFTYRIIPLLIILAIYASIFKSLQSNRSNFSAVIFRNTEIAGNSNFENVNEGTGLLERTSNLSQLTSVMRLVKENGFYNGKVSEPLLAGLIPRFLWPDKPTIALGSWFATEITGSHYGKHVRSTNSINMMIAGELYLDFGWMGVMIGSLFTGAFFAILWNATKFYSSQYNLTGIIFGGYVLIVSMSSFGADLQIVISLMSLYFTLFIIKKIVKKT